MLLHMRDGLLRKMVRRNRVVAQASHPQVEMLEHRRMLAGNLGYGFKFGQIEESDAGTAIAVDRAGNTYVAGTFHGTVDLNRSPSQRTVLTSVDDSDDAFLAKYNSRGKLLWARRFGAEGDDSATAVTIGRDGSVFLAGSYEGPAVFGEGKSAVRLGGHGDLDGYIVRLNSSGKVLWAGDIGGEMNDSITAIEPGSKGELFIAGTIRLSGDINPGKGTRTITARGADDTFVECINVADGSLKWFQVYGENDTSEGVASLAADGNGGVFVGGTFIRQVEFQRGSSAFNIESRRGTDIYVGHIGANGKWDWLNTYGGKDEDDLADMVRGPNGDLYITGNFADVVTFGTGAGATTLASVGEFDAYVARISADGSVVWVDQFAGGEDSYIKPRGIAVDGNGNVYTTGDFYGPVDFDPSDDEVIIDLEKDGDAPSIRNQPEPCNVYISRLDTNGGFGSARHIGGPESAITAYGIAADAAGNAYITGSFAGRVDLDPGSKKLIRSTAEEEEETDGFVIKVLGAKTEPRRS